MGRWKPALGVACTLALTTPTAPSTAQMTTVDFTNFGQNFVTALESVDQTLQMIEDYRVQLLQVQEMVRNGAAPAVYVYDKLDSIIDRVGNLRNFTLESDIYLKSFADPEYYRNAPCYGTSQFVDCNKQTWDMLVRDSQEARILSAMGVEVSLDTIGELITEDVTTMDEEAENLDRIQRQAQAADGHMKALAAANELAAAQAVQIMKLRQLLLAMHAATLRMQREELDRQVQQDAFRAAFYRNRAGKSPNRYSMDVGLWAHGQAPQAPSRWVPERGQELPERGGLLPPRESPLPESAPPIGTPVEPLPARESPLTDHADPLPPRSDLGGSP